MAIPFLNNIDLDNNQLLNAKLQVTSGAPTAAQGQIYFNSASGFNKVRYHDGSDWRNVLDTTSLINGTFVKATITNDVNVTLDLSATGTKDATTYLRGDNTWAVVDSYSGWKLSAGSGAAVDINEGDTVNFTGTGTTTVTRSAKTITINSADEFDGTVTSVAATHAGSAFTAAIGGTSTVNPSVDITMNGDATEYIDGAGDLTTFPNIPQGTLTGLGQGTYITIDTTIPAVPIINASGTSTPYVAATDDSKLVARDANGYAYVKKPPSGDNSTKIATTSFVQAAVTGLLEFKGGFNANTGDLDSPLTTDLYTDTAIEVGDYYVVTTAGDFFGNAATPLTVGDSVIAQEAKAAGASTESDFIVVQSDTDLATLTTVGIGNVNAGTGISVAYSNGTATITNTQTNSDNSFSGTIGDGSLTSLPITSATHGLGTDSSSFMIQLVEVSSGETVYADVTRGASGLVTIDFAAAPATNAIRVLIQKIG